MLFVKKFKAERKMKSKMYDSYATNQIQNLFNPMKLRTAFFSELIDHEKYSIYSP